MRRALRLAPTARRDLDGIWDYTLKRWGKVQAIDYLASIDATLTLIDGNPGIARSAEDVRPALLKYPCGSHILFFRITDKSIDVIRILHKSMDVERHV